MMRRRYLYIVLAFGLISGQVQAQEDGWLKKLFKKDSSENKKQQESSADSLNFLLDEYLKEADSTSTDSLTEPIEAFTPTGHGDVNVIQSQALIALNDSLKENPAPLRGYRIQIFFGKIDEAKEQRANFISAHPDAACAIDHIPPNFSVVIGNYTDKLEAYRELKALKKEYPSAIVVPSQIDIP